MQRDRCESAGAKRIIILETYRDLFSLQGLNERRDWAGADAEAEAGQIPLSQQHDR